MRIQQLFEHILDVHAPYYVERIEVGEVEKTFDIYVRMDSDAKVHCPTCERVCGRYDHRASTWRHLNLFEYRTMIHCDVPRVNCPEHGVVTSHVPWADGLTGFTMMFESWAIDWLSETSMSAVARQLGLNRKTVAAIMQRAVARGFARRHADDLPTLCVDETSFKRRHTYVTVISDPERGTVIDVTDGRTTESLSTFYRGLTPSQRRSVKRVNMDMWPAFIGATRQWIEDADNRICFDKFHVKKMILDALDKVRKAENKQLREQGSNVLTGTKYTFLSNPENMSHAGNLAFAAVRDSVNRTARAWSIKEAASHLWSYTNGFAESVYSKIQLVKSRARSFRTFETFRTAILFHCGKLELHP